MGICSQLKEPSQTKLDLVSTKLKTIYLVTQYITNIVETFFYFSLFTQTLRLYLIYEKNSDKRKKIKDNDFFYFVCLKLIKNLNIFKIFNYYINKLN